MEGMVHDNGQASAGNAVRSLEAAHESLFFLMEQFFRSGPACPGIDPVCPKIEQILLYLSRAFAREERVMDAVGFPDLTGHRLDHAALIESLEVMRRTHPCGGYDAEAMFRFLADWTTAHIETFDRPFAAYLENHQVGDDKDVPANEIG